MKKTLFLVVALSGLSTFAFAQTEKSAKQPATEDLRIQQYDPNQSKAVKVDEGVPVSKKAATKTAAKNKKNIYQTLGLTDDQIHQTQELRKSVSQKKATIEQDATMSAEQKAERLKKIEENKTSRLKEILGTKYESYIKAIASK